MCLKTGLQESLVVAVLLQEKVRGAGEICPYKGLLFKGRSGTGAALDNWSCGDKPFVELLPVQFLFSCSWTDTLIKNGQCK